MKTQEEILSLLKHCKNELQSEYRISKMALFGSYARGDQTEQSDVDVLVEVHPSIGLNFVALAQRIENELGIPTDVVSLRGIKPRYRKFIEPELIYV